MTTRELIRSISLRTDIPQQDVEYIFETAKEIIKEQLSVLEPVFFASIVKIGIENVRRPALAKKVWKTKVSIYRDIEEVVGTAIIDNTIEPKGKTLF